MSSHQNALCQKSLEALEGANAEFAAGRYNNAVALAYYHAFQLGVAARIADGQTPVRGRWRHGNTADELDKLLKSWGLSKLIGRLRDLAGERVRAQYKPPGTYRGDAEETIMRAKELGARIIDNLDLTDEEEAG